MYHTTRNNQQSGVTLLITVMVLAGLALISLSIGTFAVQSLRASRAASITEPAIGAAESGGEQGLWSIKRTGTLAACPSAGNQILSNNSLVNSCKSFAAAVFALKAGISSTFYLYDPNFPSGNGDTDMSGYPLTALTITNTSGLGPVSAVITRLDGSSAGLNPGSLTISPSTTQTVNITPVAPGTEGRIQVTLTSTSDNTITTDTYNGGTELGMPTYPTVDATGCSSKAAVTDCNNNSQEIYSRRINISVPQ